MLLNELLEKINSYKKGTYTRLSWSKNITLKDGSQITKVSNGTFRLGVKYTNVKNVKEMLASKEQTEIKPVEWVKVDFVKKSTTGKDLLMCYTTHNHKAKTKYYRDNKEININDYVDLLYAKDKQKSNNSLELFTLDVNDIIEL